MQKHRIALSSILLLAMFLCGAAAFALPLASELAAYRTDENAYAAIAEMSFNAPSPSPMPIVPLPAPTGSTENSAEPASLLQTEGLPQAGMATDAWASSSPSPNAPNPQQAASPSPDAHSVVDPVYESRFIRRSLGNHHCIKGWRYDEAHFAMVYALHIAAHSLFFSCLCGESLSSGFSL